MLYLDINQVDFLREMADCSLYKQIKLIKQKKLSKKVHSMNRKDACLENNLLSFLYCYLKYSHFKKADYSKIYE